MNLAKSARRASARSLVMLVLAGFGLALHAQERSTFVKAEAPATGSVRVYGTVTDARTGKPVYDSLVGYYDAAGHRTAVTPVNSTGGYSLFVPGGQRFELRVERENGYRELRQAFEAIPPGDAKYRQDLLLVPR